MKWYWIALAAAALLIITKKTLTAYITKAIALIKKFEGLSLKAYQDAGGLSIGYGHYLLKNELFRKITKEEAEILLEKDFSKSDAVIERYVKVSLTDNQRAALLSLIFNIGGGGFVKSTLLKKLNAGDYSSAADNFDKWIYSQGKINTTLVKRRKEEKQIFLT